MLFCLHVVLIYLLYHLKRIYIYIYTVYKLISVSIQGFRLSCARMRLDPISKWRSSFVFQKTPIFLFRNIYKNKTLSRDKTISFYIKSNKYILYIAYIRNT